MDAPATYLHCPKMKYQYGCGLPSSLSRSAGAQPERMQAKLKRAAAASESHSRLLAEACTAQVPRTLHRSCSSLLGASLRGCRHPKEDRGPSTRFRSRPTLQADIPSCQMGSNSAWFTRPSHQPCHRHILPPSPRPDHTALPVPLNAPMPLTLNSKLLSFARFISAGS
jgi:hypothetical protein